MEAVKGVEARWAKGHPRARGTSPRFGNVASGRWFGMRGVPSTTNRLNQIDNMTAQQWAADR